MNDLWVGSWCGAFAFWCDSASRGDVICSYVFVGVPSKVVKPASEGVALFVGGCVSDMCGSVPRVVFHERVHHLIRVGTRWKFVGIRVRPAFFIESLDPGQLMLRYNCLDACYGSASQRIDMDIIVTACLFMGAAAATVSRGIR